MTDLEFTILFLKAIEKKHIDYFKHSQLCIMNCVEIKGKSTVSVHVVDNTLPPEIAHDIEEMFWKG